MTNYSIYYTITSRCILNCGYCFRDTSETSLRSELPLSEIKKLIDHLYTNFRIRRLTISGGEPTFLGMKKAEQFLELMEYLRRYKQKDNTVYLYLNVITNGIFLTPEVMDKTIGIVDRYTITLDSIHDETLTKLGRNTAVYQNYLNRIKTRFSALTQKDFEIKLHSVVSKVNLHEIPELVSYIKNSPEFNIKVWKFFQYTTFGNADADAIYSISDEEYWHVFEIIKKILADSPIKPLYKDVKSEEETMFNLLPDGRIKYYTFEDGIKHIRYSRPLFDYNGWEEFLSECPVNEATMQQRRIQSKEWL